METRRSAHQLNCLGTAKPVWFSLPRQAEKHGTDELYIKSVLPEDGDGASPRNVVFKRIDAAVRPRKLHWRSWKLKEEALHCTLWTTHDGRGYGPVIRQTAEWRGYGPVIRQTAEWRGYGPVVRQTAGRINMHTHTQTLHRALQSRVKLENFEVFTYT
jgi:hypothetical protein